MSPFKSVREAKEYLIQRILARAERDATPLSDIERKMLYFSETGWTLPNIMAINQEFDEAYDQDEYERKIGQIICRIHDQPDTERDKERWDEALKCLREEDHYLLVLIDGASKYEKRPRWDTIRLIFVGVIVVALFFPILSFIESHVSNPGISKLIGQSTFLALALFATFLANRRYRGTHR
jgi:hypothetical protein